MEPKSITMVRDVQKERQRCPGDGMEDHTLEQHIKSVASSYKISKSKMHTPITKMHTPITKKVNASNFNDSFSDSIYSNVFTTPEQTFNNEPSHEETLKSLADLSIANDMLKTQLNLYHQHNDQLTEQKMKLSQQLGIQTQVNSEVKNLLIASIGEDLQQKYERLIEDKVQVDLELSHLRNVLDEDREEVEQAMIHADIWRSKFLASRVMSDELARWKSVLYYKYRDSHTALQNLLHEHSKMRALNNITRRGLVRFAELLECKDPSLDTISPLTTLDVALMNTDLVESLITVMEETECEKTPEDSIEKEKIDITATSTHSSEKSPKRMSTNKDIYIEASELTPAEQLAQEIVLNPGIKSEELARMRHDYLSHNRISHFMSTNYNATYNCCVNCKGPIYIV